MLVGVVSDTHGVLPEAAVAAFEDAGVERIIHAGDLGSPGILAELEAVAPVTAVLGNVDDPAMPLPGLANTVIGGVRVLVTHRPADVPRPLPPGVRVVVTGHTHVPLVEERDGVLWLNPGSASRARSARGHTVALLDTGGGAPSARIVPIP